MFRFIHFGKAVPAQSWASGGGGGGGGLGVGVVGKGLAQDPNSTWAALGFDLTACLSQTLITRANIFHRVQCLA